MNREKPTVEELRDQRRFELITDLAHSEIIRFVQAHLKSLTWITGSYWLVNAAALGLLLVRCVQSKQTIWDSFATACLGMLLGYLLLLPVHEWIHALAYRTVGAQTTVIRYNLARLTASCEAPGAVVGGGEFVLVCLAPFLTLNPALAVAALLVTQGKAALLVSGALLLHIGGCSGDVALVNFVWKHRGRALFTYDDGDERHGYFFRALSS